MSSPGRFAPHKQAARYVVVSSPPPEALRDRVVYGLMQPLFGVRTLFRDRELLRAALIPAGLLALCCAAVAFVSPATASPETLSSELGKGVNVQMTLPPALSLTVTGVLRRFYQTFVVLAPVPSVLLARHYARLAALARNKLGFGPVEPCLEPFWRAVKRVVAQAVLVAIGLLPLIAVLQILPVIGSVLLHATVALWALHWIVVEAFDSARVLRPGETLADIDRLAESAPRPWFVRILTEAKGRLPLGGLLARFGRWCDKLALPWREEIVLVERHPALMVGFSLTTAALVATPVLNLLFRPIILVAAAHVVGQLEATTPEAPAQRVGG